MKKIDVLITQDSRALWLKEGAKIPIKPNPHVYSDTGGMYARAMEEYRAAIAALEKEGVLIEDFKQAVSCIMSDCPGPPPKGILDAGIYRGVKVPDFKEVTQWRIKGTTDEWIDQLNFYPLKSTHEVRKVLRFVPDSEPQIIDGVTLYDDRAEMTQETFDRLKITLENSTNIVLNSAIKTYAGRPIKIVPPKGCSPLLTRDFPEYVD